MLIYLLILLLLIISITLPKGYDKITLPLILFVLIVIGILRDISVGTDLSGGYDEIFYTTTMDQRTWNTVTPVEPGFNYLNAFFKIHIANNFYLFYGLLFLLTMLLIFSFIKKMCVRPVMGVTLIYFYYLYFSTFNGVRQWMAFALCLPFLFDYIKRRNIISFIIFVSITILISIFIHGSVISLLAYPVLIFLETKSISKNRLLVFLLVSLIFYFCRASVLSVFEKILFLLIPRYQMYINAGIGTLTAMYTRRRATVVLAFMFCLAVTLFSKDRDSSFFAFYFYCIGTIMFVPIVPILSRIFMMYFMLGIPYLANIGWGRKRLISKGSHFFCRAYILLYGLFTYCLAVFQNFSEVIPYRSWFFR